MTRDEAQTALVRMLIEKVRQDKYPSFTQMELIEESIPPELIEDYFEVLAEKVMGDEFPSIPMMRRLQRVAHSLPSQAQVGRAEPDVRLRRPPRRIRRRARSPSGRAARPRCAAAASAAAAGHPRSG